MIQTLRNTLSTISLVGAISFALTSVVDAQGLKTNQGSFGSGWQVGNSSSEASPYAGSSSGSYSSPGYGGGSSGGGYNAVPGGQGGYSGSSTYGKAPSGYGSSGSQSSTTSPQTTEQPSAPRSAGGGLRVQ